MKEKIIFALKWFYKSYIWLFIVLLGLDIATKQIVLSLRDTVNAQGHIAEWGFVNIGFVLNYNAAFGLGADGTETGHLISRVVYLIVASLAVIGITTYLILKRKNMSLYIRACLIMIIAGAIGNMIDRIFYGPEYAVVDWIDFWWFWGYNFNIADSCIVVSAFMLIIYILVSEVKEMIKRRNAELQVEQAKDSNDKKTAEPENIDSERK